MSDALYLSLWYPNLRLAELAAKAAAVLGAFAAHGGQARVYAATVWPVSWSESPVFQHVYGRGARGAEPAQAVADAMELLHEDYAYEFQIGWSLWALETMQETALEMMQEPSPSEPGPVRLQPEDAAARWVREERLVRVTAFGPLFDDGAYQQDGHIRVDFGNDGPLLAEEADLDQAGAEHVEENVRQLVELTAVAEKQSGATARLLWSELGESLAERLAARLSKGN